MGTGAGTEKQWAMSRKREREEPLFSAFLEVEPEFAGEHLTEWSVIRARFCSSRHHETIGPIGRSCRAAT
jgi:hypothetical protein